MRLVVPDAFGLPASDNSRKGGPQPSFSPGLHVNASQKYLESATPPVAILCMLTTYVFFTFLDTSSKYLVLAGVSALIVAWVRFAVHVVLVGTLLRG